MLLVNARYAIYTLWLALYSLVSVVLGTVMLAMVAQGTEVLYAFVERTPGDNVLDSQLRMVLLLLAVACWALANWYGARLLLQRDFPDVAPVHTEFAGWWREWMPRGLGVAGPLLLGLLLPAVGGSDRAHNVMRVVFGGVGVLVALFTWKRRDLVNAMAARRQSRAAGAEAAAPALMAPASEQRPGMTPGDGLTLWFTLAAATVLVYAVVQGSPGLSRFLGASTLLFLALAGLTLFGSVVLIYLPRWAGGPSLALLPLVLFLAFAQLGWTHNHALSDRPQAQGTKPDDPRPTAVEHFRQWLAQHPSSDKIVLVAAEGGASRSAWWTAYVLGAADHASQGEFSRRTFALSGISGGSLGVATHLALLARRGPVADMLPAYPDVRACERLRTAPATLAMEASCFLGRDFLSPTVGYMLYPDFLQRFWPLKNIGWDRSHGLEDSWRQDWAALFGQDTWGEPLQNLYAGSAPGAPAWRTDLPVLLLNSAQASTGLQAIQSSVRLATVTGATSTDLLARWPHANALPLAALVHNSARFPVVSPGGQIFEERSDGQQHYFDTLVDGGYFENSGAHALLQLLQSVELGYAKEEWQALRSRFVVLFITNDPPDPRGGKEPGTGCTLRKAGEGDPSPILQEELLTPLIGLYKSRSARAAAARHELVQYLNQGADPNRAVGFEIPLDGARIAQAPPSMTWYMTEGSRNAMWQSLAVDGCARRRLQAAFAAVNPASAPAWTARLAAQP